MSNSRFNSMQNRHRVANVLRVFRPEYPYLTPSLDDNLQQSQDETPVAKSGAEHAGFRRLLPDVLCCNDCRAQIAFASQIIHKPFHTQGPGSYIVAPPPRNIGHTYGPAFDPEPVDNEEDNDDDPAMRNVAPDANYYRDNVEYAIRRRRDNLHNIVLSDPQACVDNGRGKVIICVVRCARCGWDLGLKNIDIEDPYRMHEIGMFHLTARRLFTQRSYASVSDATVAAMDRNLMHGLNQEESTLQYLDNTHGLLTPPPDVATWKSRSGGTFSLAEADPHGAVRSLQAQRNHRLSVVGHATQYRLAAGKHRQALEAKSNGGVTRRRLSNQGTQVQTIAPPRSDRWNPNKDDAAHIPTRCFSAQDLEEVRTQGALYFDSAEDKIFESLYEAQREGNSDLSARQPEMLRAKLEASGSEHLHNDTWALRERRCAIAPQTIEFDSDDEDECEALFSGRWCSREVAVQRAKKEQDKLARQQQSARKRPRN